MGHSLRSNKKKALRAIKRQKVLADDTTLKNDAAKQEVLQKVINSAPVDVTNPKSVAEAEAAARGRDRAGSSAKGGRKQRAAGGDQAMEVDRPGKTRNGGLKVKKADLKRKLKPVSKLIQITKMNMQKKKKGDRRLENTAEGYIY